MKGTKVSDNRNDRDTKNLMFYTEDIRIILILCLN